MRNDGGAAFPIASDGDVLHDATFQDGRMSGGEWKARSPGMSLRDYFAAAALPLVLETAMYNDAMVARQQGGQTFNDALAAQCYQIADAMLLERDKP